MKFRTALLASAALCFIAARSLAGPPKEAFTPEELEVNLAWEREFAEKPRQAEILRGTRLYLNRPHHSRFYNINSLGLRGPEPKRKEEGAFHVVVLGGSTVFGDTYKADDQTIPAMLESLLKERHPERSVAVYNLGIVGYEFQREIDLAKKYWQRLDPDLILFYHGANDLTCAYLQGYVDLKPFTSEDRTFLTRPFKEGGDHFHKRIRLLRRKLYGDFLGYGPDAPKRLPEHRDSLIQGYIRDAAAADRFFREKGVPVLFVLQPILATRAHPTEIEKKVALEYENDYPRLGDFYREFLSGLKSKPESRSLDLHDFTGVLDPSEETHFFDFVHVNLAGNRIIAQKLCELIEAGGFLRRGRP